MRKEKMRIGLWCCACGAHACGRKRGGWRKAKLAAKTVTVSGTVIEEDTNEPAFSASVVLLKTGRQHAGHRRKFDLDGKFSIKGVKPGKYIFRITSVGFKPYFKDLQVTSARTTVPMGIIKLQTNAAVLDAIEVTARQAQVEMKADTFCV